MLVLEMCVNRREITSQQSANCRFNYTTYCICLGTDKEFGNLKLHGAKCCKVEQNKMVSAVYNHVEKTL